MLILELDEDKSRPLFLSFELLFLIVFDSLIFKLLFESVAGIQ